MRRTRGGVFGFIGFLLIVIIDTQFVDTYVGLYAS